MNTNHNGNEWLDGLRAEEAMTAPRPEFKAGLRNRVAAEWDNPGSADTLTDAATQAAPVVPLRTPDGTNVIPVTAPPGRPGFSEVGPDRSGPSGPGRGGKPNFEWHQLARVAAVVALVGSGVFLMTRRTQPTAVEPTQTDPVASLVTTPATDAPQATVETSPSTTAQPTPTTSTPATTEVEATTPKTDPVVAAGPLFLTDWPAAPANPVTSMDNFRYYLPAKAVPGETEVLKSANSIELNPNGDPTYLQVYQIGDTFVTISTRIGIGNTAVVTGDTIDTSAWINQWPDAQYAMSPAGAATIVLTNDQGSVTITGVGMDRAALTQIAAGMLRRPTPEVGWNLSTSAQKHTEAWGYDTNYVQALFLSDPDTPVTQLTFGDADYQRFPWFEYGSDVQYVDINGQPGAVGSYNGMVIVNWITGSGDIVRVIHTGDWAEAVAIARNVQQVDVNTWNDRIDGTENRTGHEVDCFYLTCDF